MTHGIGRATYILGIDPGLTGAMVLIESDKTHRKIISLLDMEKTEELGRKPVLDGGLLAQQLRGLNEMYPIHHAIIEHVSSAPGAGVSTSFSFGKTTGMTIGVLCGLRIPYLSIHPAVWKKTFGLSTNKDDSRFKAAELFHEHRQFFARKKDHNRAEAALLAVHGEAFI